MRYGYRMGMGYGFYGAFILTIILVIAVVILLVIIMENKKGSNTQVQEPLEMLRERYARGEISADEYREKKNFIEDEKNLDQAVLILMKRYVSGEINKEEYHRIKKEIS